jgi:hypothetical protein
MAYEQPRTNINVADLLAATRRLEQCSDDDGACIRVAAFLRREVSKRLKQSEVRAAGIQIEGERK